MSGADRAFLEELLRKGELKARAYRRALGLLELDRGKCFTEVAETLQVSIPSISRWAKEYQAHGLQAIEDQHRSGRPMVIDGQRCLRLRHSRAVNRRNGMVNGAYAYLPTKRSNWAMSRASRILKCARFSKKTNANRI